MRLGQFVQCVQCVQCVRCVVQCGLCSVCSVCSVLCAACAVYVACEEYLCAVCSFFRVGDISCCITGEHVFIYLIVIYLIGWCLFLNFIFEVFFAYYFQIYLKICMLK